MSLVDHTQEFQVDYSWEKTFDALKKVFSELDRMKLESANKITKSFSVKAGVSLFSWGENITVTLTPIDDSKTKISVLSTPKTGVMFGGTMDMGKNRKNIQAIMDELAKRL